MSTEENNEDLFELITKKSLLKKSVFNNTYNAFGLIKKEAKSLTNSFDLHQNANNRQDAFELATKSRGKFEFDIKFGGDILIFVMHTNIFEFPRHHNVMRTDYVKDETDRSYCGVINIYNFIADSFKFKRVKDIGYLIGRIFINVN